MRCQHTVRCLRSSAALLGACLVMIVGHADVMERALMPWSANTQWQQESVCDQHSMNLGAGEPFTPHACSMSARHGAAGGLAVVPVPGGGLGAWCSCAPTLNRRPGGQLRCASSRAHTLQTYTIVAVAP